MARVQELRALLPRAKLLVCKAALENANGDVETAKAALLSECGNEWAALDDEAAASKVESGDVSVPH